MSGRKHRSASDFAVIFLPKHSQDLIATLALVADSHGTGAVRFQEGDRRMTVSELCEEVRNSGASGLKVVLVAPAGCGKTVLSKQLVRALSDDGSQQSGLLPIALYKSRCVRRSSCFVV